MPPDAKQAHSHQHRCPPSIGNALSLWGLAAVILVTGFACQAPRLLACTH